MPRGRGRRGTEGGRAASNRTSNSTSEGFESTSTNQNASEVQHSGQVTRAYLTVAGNRDL